MRPVASFVVAVLELQRRAEERVVRDSQHPAPFVQAGGDVARNLRRDRHPRHSALDDGGSARPVESVESIVARSAHFSSSKLPGLVRVAVNPSTVGRQTCLHRCVRRRYINGFTEPSDFFPFASWISTHHIGLLGSGSGATACTS